MTTTAHAGDTPIPDVQDSLPPVGHENHPGRAHHDLGGVSRYLCLPVDIEPHALTTFDRRVDALRQLLSAKGLMSVDELRRGIEAIPEAEYHALSYYQRWMRSITTTLLRRGVIDEAGLRAALAATGTAAPDTAGTGASP